MANEEDEEKAPEAPESGSWVQSASDAVTKRAPTWFRSAEAVREQKEADKREAEDAVKEAREDRNDNRVDTWAQRSLEQAEKRAVSAERTIRYWMVFAVFCVLVICVLAGYSVGLTIPGIGSFTGGGKDGIEVQVEELPYLEAPTENGAP